MKFSSYWEQAWKVSPVNPENSYAYQLENGLRPDRIDQIRENIRNLQPKKDVVSTNVEEIKKRVEDTRGEDV